MEIIIHRRNTMADLKATPTDYGVELDVRSFGGRLVIHHDPFVVGEDFQEWLSVYEHGTLILNVKEEGLEYRLVELMARHGVNNYFFLDQSFPFLVKSAQIGEKRCAVRVSEYESIDTAMALAGKIDWIWVDCFTKFPLIGKDATRLKKAGFRLCLVSPELQGRDAVVEIPQLARFIREERIRPDAVCTKRPDIWEKMVLSV